MRFEEQQFGFLPETEFEALEASPPLRAAALPGRPIGAPPPAPRETAAAGFRLSVVSYLGRPLDKARWTIFQGGKVFRGTLDAQGRSNEFDLDFRSFDRTRPFQLHIDGYACIIISGAALVVNEDSVEYGGQFLDWNLANSSDRAVRDAFWREYQLERKTPARDVFRLYQHDHIMRRRIQLLSGATHAAFEAKPVSIRVGPMVRYTGDRSAVIWLELETPGMVRVRYGKAGSQEQLPPIGIPPAETARHAATVRVGGRHYALVCLDRLEPDSVYIYTLEIAPLPPTGNIPVKEADFIEEVFPRALPPAVRDEQRAQLTKVSHRGDRWLYFRTLRQDYKELRFAHGSCRKWPGDREFLNKPDDFGSDMLEKFGSEWMTLRDWKLLPRFLLLTGDQIYADDIGAVHRVRILRSRFASTLAGPSPRAANDIAYGAWAGRFSFRCIVRPAREPAPPKDNVDLRRLRPNIKDRSFYVKNRVVDEAIRTRKQTARLGTGAFADAKRPLRFKYQVLNSLLWQPPFQENDVPLVDKSQGALRGLLSPSEHRVEYPSAGDNEGVHAADYAEYSDLYEFAWSTPHARKVFAHLPSFMIFDDHEVADDWNADALWVKVAYSTRDRMRFWPETITDALCAYWLYQGWGNLSPQAWAADERVQILERCRAQGRDALPELRRLVFARAVQPAGDARANRLAWNYSLPIRSPEFHVVDLRTAQDLGRDSHVRLSKERRDWIERTLLQSKSSAAFLVLPTPFLIPDPLLFAFRNPRFTATLAGADSVIELKRGLDIEHSAGNRVWDQIKDLLVKLRRNSPMKTLGIISGDVHFSCNLDGQLPGAARPPRLLQLISSGIRQKISSAKQGQLFSAYRGKLNLVTGSGGVDPHRGVRITLGGLYDQRLMSNFLFEPSIALVDVTIGSQGGVAVPAIRQTHLFVDGKTGKLAQRTFNHVTRPDGTGAMTVAPPDPSRPSPDYPGRGEKVIPEIGPYAPYGGVRQFEATQPQLD